MLQQSTVKDWQDSLDEKIYFSSKESFSSVAIPQLFKEISENDRQIIIRDFDDLGQRLLRFSATVDLDSRPEKNNLIVESILSYLNAIKFGYHDFIKLFKEEIIKNLNKDSEIKRIDDPHLNNQFIRFLKNKEQRDFLRKNKSIHEIGLNSFSKKGNWETYPINFKFYERFNSDYYEEIDKIKKLADRYKSIGCIKLYEGIAGTVKDLEDLYHDSYLGFNRITMSTAAIIMARMHKFDFFKFGDNYTITINNNLLKINLEKPKSAYCYKPKAYPCHELKSIISERTAKLIEHLENNPDLNGQATFDHFIVMVPTIDYGFSQDLVADKFFDLMLLKNESFTPILLGEKDGKCYFVSYFI